MALTGPWTKMKPMSTGRAVLSWVLAAVVGAAFPANPATADPGDEALVFNRAGVGHLLIVPYFSAQAGNATLMSLVNTDDSRGKAIKVRFRGASNADTVFDFQLFLAPGGTWTANVSRGRSGLARLETTDRSCTLPANINRDFDTSRLNPALSGDALANETREGYVEMINMGDIPMGAGTNSLGHAILPCADGLAPCTASLLGSLTVGDARLEAPSTGLFANWLIINVLNTTVWSGSAEAIEGQANRTAVKGRNVYWPQTASLLSRAETEANTADPLLLDGKVEVASHDLPDLSTPYTLGAATPVVQATRLSDALAATQAAAEFFTDPTIVASTDWIVSQPTRRYYAAVDYMGATAPDQLVTNFDDCLIYDADYYRARLSDGGGSGNTVMGSSANGCRPWQASALLSADKFWNREGVSPTPVSPIATPVPLPPMAPCGAVSVIGINSQVSPIAAAVTRINWIRPRPDLALYGNESLPDVPLIDGWGRLTALNRLTVNLFEGPNLGLPMLVAQFSKASNPAVAPGVSGTFGGAWKARVVQRGAYYTN